jgi:hypothetical protein
MPWRRYRQNALSPRDIANAAVAAQPSMRRKSGAPMNSGSATACADIRCAGRRRLRIADRRFRETVER